MSSTSKEIVKVIYKKVVHGEYTVTIVYSDKTKLETTFSNSGIAKQYLKEQRKQIKPQPTEGETPCQTQQE